MSINKLIYSMLCLLFIANLSFAQDQDKVAFISAIKDAKTNMKSIACKFEQTVIISVLSDKQTSRGNFYYKSPGLLKWEQMTPEVYTLVVNGDQSYKKVGEERKNLSAGSLQLTGIKRFILGALEGSIFISDHFETSVVKNQNKWEVEMVPVKKALAKRFDKIRLTFEEEALLLHQMTFDEPGGDQRIIDFKDHKINTLTDDTHFQ